MEQSERPPAGGDAAYILTLDEGLLHKICACLAVNDLLSAQCTCRQLNSFIASDKDLWRSLFIPNSISAQLTDARLLVLVSRASGGLETLDIRGGPKVTGSFLLSDSMKASTGLQKLWLLECPNLSSASVVNLVGHIVQTCSQEGLVPRLSSIRLAGSQNSFAKHVRILEKIVPSSLDITPCPACPKAGRVLVCRMVTLLEALAAEGSSPNALVRGGEFGCESCLVRCSLCREFFCAAHLFSLPCGLSEVCCQCCGYHQCRLCGNS